MDRRSEAKIRRTAKAVAASDDALCTLLSAGLRVQAGEDRWRVIGNTLSYRLLLREAGGFVSDLDGGQDMLEKGSLCAGSEIIQRELLALLRAV